MTAKTIKKIRDIRRKNNEHWMRVLKIAMKHAPEETKKVLRFITKNDRAVSRLTEKLAA